MSAAIASGSNLDGHLPRQVGIGGPIHFAPPAPLLAVISYGLRRVARRCSTSRRLHTM
jgi:hypothetical protein